MPSNPTSNLKKAVPAWLPYLNLQYFTDSLANFDIEQTLRHKYTYEQVPVLETGEKVTASLSSEYYWSPRDRETGSREKTSYTVTLQTASRGSYSSIGIDVRCSSRESQYSGPSQALLIDLAIYPALRQALAEGEPVEPLLENLAAVREQACRDFVAHQALRSWAPGEQPQAAPSPEYALSVYDTVEEYYNRYNPPSFRNNPILEIRPRLPGKRAILSEEERKNLRFPPADGQILRDCRPLPTSRKGFHVNGSDAAMVLHLLQDREVTLEKDGSPVIFAKTPVFLKMRVTRMPRKQVGARNTLNPNPHHYHHRYMDEGEKPAPHDPTLDVVVNALEAYWHTRDGEFEIASADAVMVAGLYAYLWAPVLRTFYPISPLVDMEAAWRLFLNPSIVLVEGHGPMLYRELRGQLQGAMIALPEPAEMGLSPAETPEFILRIDGTPLEVRLYLEAQYSFGLFPLFPGPSLEELASARNTDLEAAAVELISRLQFVENVRDNCFVCGSDERAAWFWMEGIESLKDADPKLSLKIPAKLRATRVRKRLQARLKVALVSGWFDTEVQLQTEGLNVDLAQLQESVEGKKRWVALNDGSLAELTEELRELLQEGLDVMSGSGQARLAVHQVGRLDQWMHSPEVTVETDKQVDALRERSIFFSNFSKLAGDKKIGTEVELPRDLNAELRPYQIQGLAWLRFLHDLSAGGILADDMGLGKTLMTLAMIAWRKEKEGELPNLIVCPTSVTANWIKEAARFTPGLKTALLTGKEREILRAACLEMDEAAGGSKWPAALQEVDIFVTSYGLLRRDAEMLARFQCRYVVLDEAQNIKNYNTATAKAARRLQGEAKLALSGTPVENRLAELYSLLEFCNPGMLGSKTLFSRRFENPILSDSRGIAARRLRAIIRPFVLRRTKRQVLKDLPPKQEIEYFCTLGVEQKQHYDALAAIVRGDIGQTIQSEGLAKNQIKLLTALLRLRQMACDPRLVDRTLSPAYSTKRNEFVKLVRSLVSEGRRALVFSQFVELLHLWIRDLDREGIAYEYLDGSTRDREAVISRFQNGDAPLFLISLKAGGTGLNLTAADTVIHCDPWWNPAVEDQATDRAHRIGQTRPVTVYRLVASGTVEDKIIQLKARKRELADAVITDDGAALRGLSVEDAQLLLGDASGARFEESDEENEEETTEAIAEEVPLPSKPAASSILDKTSGEELKELGRMMQAWLDREGKKQKHLAKAVQASSYTVGQLLRGKKKSMPTLEYERVRAMLISFGIE
ncbi:MAG: hypothetical protein GY862_32330 [Gammaproteobacteria bacterium]|nr:hypothetical protein [Gammaproteobacteria bacterium]